MSVWMTQISTDIFSAILTSYAKAYTTYNQSPLAGCMGDVSSAECDVLVVEAVVTVVVNGRTVQTIKYLLTNVVVLHIVETTLRPNNIFSFTKK